MPTCGYGCAQLRVSQAFPAALPGCTAFTVTLQGPTAIMGVTPGTCGEQREGQGGHEREGKVHCKQRNPISV